MGLHAGVPVTEKKSIFEDTIKLAQGMGLISMREIVVSTEVQQLFESENLGEVLNPRSNSRFDSGGRKIHSISSWDLLKKSGETPK